MDFNIKLTIYIIVAALVVLYGSITINTLYGLPGAGIYFLGSVYICFLYGTKWFGAGTSNTVTSWPPVINTCPDYLTYYPGDRLGNNKNTCIDTIGVSKNGMLKKFPKDGDAPTDPSFYFSLTVTTADKVKELCQRAIQSGLTWEGITNGESCISPNGQPGGTKNAPNTCPPVGPTPGQ